MSSDDTTPAPSSDDSVQPAPVDAADVADGAETVDGADEPTALGRRDAVREKAQLVQAQQSRARAIRRSALIVGVVASVAVVAFVVSWAVGGAASRPQLTPDAQNDGFLVASISAGDAAVSSPDDGATPDATALGDATPTPTPSPTESAAAPVEIHVYVDYLSPSAREWQLANSPQLSSWVAQGAATLTYHPVAMLTAKSNGTKYSLRAASAAACVATYAPTAFYAFNDELLTRQPAVDSDGFSDKDLADIAGATGGTDAPAKLRECIETGAYASWVKDATERAIAGIEGTDGLSLTGNSMVTVNGQAYVGDPTDPAEFAQFVLTSASGKAMKSQSATPTPTPTPSATP